ncbi:MAG: transglutaminase domain-containing protein [Verrucomicrobia bacterium]|nr:transglutaminase domain-containing protein [Verrucomicrobiota bacterium]
MNRLATSGAQFWRWLAIQRPLKRASLKLALLAAVVLFALYPNPVLLIRQVNHLLDMEQLIQPNLTAMPEINREIDRLIETNTPALTEFKAVERFVYRRIPYQYDWHGWANLDYWPSAAEVWERKREDCDGRAVLAASILRARGHADARLVANLQHVWVAVGTNELMGPMADKNFRREGGKTIVTFPTLKTLLDSLAMTCKFPAWRVVLMLVTLLALVFHPATNNGRLMMLCAVMLAGYTVFLDWCVRRLDRDSAGFDWNLPVAAALIVGALAFAWRTPKTQAQPMA